MKTKLELTTWKRKAHFEFFNSFEDPFWGLTANVDCHEAYIFSQKKNISFFLLYLHRSLLAANAMDEFKMRIENGEVYIYDKVHASPTISREDKTFGFAYFDFYEDFETFAGQAAEEIRKVRSGKDLIPATKNENVIHYSSIPWISFRAVEYPRFKPGDDSIPKITFGKLYKEKGKFLMPVSVLVNHALMDAYHIGNYLNSFQKLLEQSP